MKSWFTFAHVFDLCCFFVAYLYFSYVWWCVFSYVRGAMRVYARKSVWRIVLVGSRCNIKRRRKHIYLCSQCVAQCEFENSRITNCVRLVLWHLPNEWCVCVAPGIHLYVSAAAAAAANPAIIHHKLNYFGSKECARRKHYIPLRRILHTHRNIIFASGRVFWLRVALCGCRLNDYPLRGKGTTLGIWRGRENVGLLFI